MAVPRPRRHQSLPFLPIIRAKVRPQAVVILSPQLELFQTHFTPDGRRPCMRGTDRPCPECGRLIERRPYIYALALELASGKPGIVEITIGAFENRAELHDIAGDARGWKVVLERMTKNPKGPVRAGVRYPRQAVDALPPAGDQLWRGLARLWSLDVADVVAAAAAAGDQNEPTEQLAGEPTEQLAGDAAADIADQLTRGWPKLTPADAPAARAEASGSAMSAAASPASCSVGSPASCSPSSPATPRPSGTSAPPAAAELPAASPASCSPSSPATPRPSGTSAPPAAAELPAASPGAPPARPPPRRAARPTRRV
jgi:hypothetical protein